MTDWTETLAELARQLGCKVTRMDGAARAIHVECPDLQAKVDLLHAVAVLSSRDPAIQSFAQILRETWRTDAEFVAGVTAWIQQNVVWRDEPGDRFAHALVTLRSLSGDCDCSAILLVATLLAGGVEAECRGLLDDTGDGAHACGVARLARRWHWCEASTPRAAVGEHPRRVQERG